MGGNRKNIKSTFVDGILIWYRLTGALCNVSSLQVPEGGDYDSGVQDQIDKYSEIQEICEISTRQVERVDRLMCDWLSWLLTLFLEDCKQRKRRVSRHGFQWGDSRNTQRVLSGNTEKYKSKFHILNLDMRKILEAVVTISSPCAIKWFNKEPWFNSGKSIVSSSLL